MMWAGFAFSDRDAWDSESPRTMFLDPDTLIDLYQNAYGQEVKNIEWYRALGGLQVCHYQWAEPEFASTR